MGDGDDAETERERGSIAAKQCPSGRGGGVEGGMKPLAKAVA